MQTINDIKSLEALYGQPVPTSLSKVVNKITPLYREWIEASHFVIVATVGAEGTDASPRGDESSVVKIIDPQTIYLPDWKGNNRIDSLRNIVTDGRISLLFMVPHCDNVIRVNGVAQISVEAEIIDGFVRNNARPRSVIVVEVNEAYFQCAKALMRSKLWSAEPEHASVPTAGQFIKEVKSDFDATTYDRDYQANSKDRMW